jgi:hypothetical protein
MIVIFRVALHAVVLLLIYLLGRLIYKNRHDFILFKEIFYARSKEDQYYYGDVRPKIIIIALCVILHFAITSALVKIEINEIREKLTFYGINQRWRSDESCIYFKKDYKEIKMFYRKDDQDMQQKLKGIKKNEVVLVTYGLRLFRFPWDYENIYYVSNIIRTYEG